MVVAAAGVAGGCCCGWEFLKKGEVASEFQLEFNDDCHVAKLADASEVVVETGSGADGAAEDGVTVDGGLATEGAMVVNDGAEMIGEETEGREGREGMGAG